MNRDACRRFFRVSMMVVAALALGAGFARLGVPAPFLMSSMLVAAALSWRGVHVRTPPRLNHLAQACVGVFIAGKIAPGVAPQVVAFIPWFAVITLATLAFCGLLGVVLSRSGFIAGTSAVWGLSPGAATAMIVMADEFGANWQMVSLMQYTRVILVIMSSVFVVGMGDSLSLPMLVSQLSLFDLSAGLGSAAIVLASLILAHYVKWPAAHLLYPMVLGTVVMKWFDVIYSPPVFVMVVAYLVLGIRIGEGFSRVLIQKFRLILGRLVLAILALISFSLASSYLFALATGIDFKTAYLAFSPGGLDTAALIGASTHVNMNIVMASQSVRMFIVILVAPMMAKFIVRRFALTGEGNKF